MVQDPSYHSIQSIGATPGEEKPLPSTKYALGRGDRFPTKRRPQARQLTQEPMDIIEVWFHASQITIGLIADTLERVVQCKRLLYTWKNCFAESVRDIKASNLIELSIDLTNDASHLSTHLRRGHLQCNFSCHGRRRDHCSTKQFMGSQDEITTQDKGIQRAESGL